MYTKICGPLELHNIVKVYAVESLMFVYRRQEIRNDQDLTDKSPGRQEATKIKINALSAM